MEENTMNDSNYGLITLVNLFSRELFEEFNKNRNDPLRIDEYGMLSYFVISPNSKELQAIYADGGANSSLKLTITIDGVQHDVYFKQEVSLEIYFQYIEFAFNKITRQQKILNEWKET